MRNKIILCFVILTLFLTISSCSANENMTDFQTLDNSSDVGVANESVVNKSVSEIQAQDLETYYHVNETFEVTLTSDSVALNNKTVTLNLNNVTYNKTTDINGKAILNFKQPCRNHVKI